MKDGVSYKDRDMAYLVDVCEMKEELQEMWDRLMKLRKAEVMEYAHELCADCALDHINQAMVQLWCFET